MILLLNSANSIYTLPPCWKYEGSFHLACCPTKFTCPPSKKHPYVMCQPNVKFVIHIIYVSLIAPLSTFQFITLQFYVCRVCTPVVHCQLLHQVTHVESFDFPRLHPPITQSPATHSVMCSLVGHTSHPRAMMPTQILDILPHHDSLLSSAILSIGSSHHQTQQSPSSIFTMNLSFPNHPPLVHPSIQ